jgi:hypothetical protein
VGGHIETAFAELASSKGWRGERLEDGAGMTFQVQGATGIWDCVAITNDLLGYFVFYSVLPLTVEPERRAELAEFVCRANDGMLTGNFEFRIDDGRLRYKTSLDAEGIEEHHLPGTVLRSLIDHLVEINLEMFDKYLPDALAVAVDGDDPAEAVARAEAS